MKLTKRQLRRIIREAVDTAWPADTETVSGRPRGKPPIDPATALADYKEWAVDYMGTPGGANSSSVLATYAYKNGMTKRDWTPIADAMGFDPDDVRRDIVRQKGTDAWRRRRPGPHTRDRRQHDP